jgi:outer membrane protein OmpA-like peptidoglycan-associated protein
MTMKLKAANLVWIVVVSIAIGLLPRARAQIVEQGVAIVSETIAGRVDGFSYSPDSSSDIEFLGTLLAPRTAGEAGIRVSHDRTEIDAKFQRLADPASLGPYAVYVMWVVTPQGRAINVGKLDIDGDKARLKTSTPLSSFALIVTAEPHFAVSIPSKGMILQNVGKNVKGTKVAVTSLAAREDYSSLKPIAQDQKHPIPLDLEMARYAVAIAAAAGAKDLASVAFERSRQSLASAEAAFVSKKRPERDRVGEYARDAIQAGEDARAGAEIRRADAENAGKASEIKTGVAKVAQLTAELADARERALNAERQLPNSATRLALASELLSRWFTLPPATESGLTMHVSEDMFLKSSSDLVPAMQQRMALATGVLLGIGKMNVSVTPSVQTTNDMQKLSLSQQRARSVMEWLTEKGVRAVLGTASPDADASLALGPGVDLLIASGVGEPTDVQSAKIKSTE